MDGESELSARGSSVSDRAGHLSEQAEVERLRASMKAIERDLETERRLRQEAQEMSKEMQVSAVFCIDGWSHRASL